MCGILGISGGRGAALVDSYLDLLSHRGPDGRGVWSDDRLALGHRRLSIIGLSEEGAQPRSSRSGESVLVFNGEIYNYLELADELEREGREVDRRFDTAVLLEALETWGVEVLPRLDGMFAFAWYRPREQRVVLARDRWGKKPLFWGRVRLDDGTRPLVFASELRVFAALPGGPPPTHPLGVARYLTYDGMPGRETIYRGVEKLPAATWAELTLEGEVKRESRYWQFVRRPRPMSVDDAVAELEVRLARAVSLRLRSDVPVGLFLSGGIDSSLLASTWHELGRPLQTFTVAFDDPSYDEGPRARELALRLGATHHEIRITDETLEGEIDRIWANLSEPFADASIIPTALLCRRAREHATVVLGGDGSDELQAGYDPFRAWAPSRWIDRTIGGARGARLASALESILPVDDGNGAARFRVHHLARGLALPPVERIQGWMAAFTPQQALDVMHPDLAADVSVEEILEPTRRAYRASLAQGELAAQISTWIATYLEACILTKVDRASMQSGLEVRAPFLDPDLAEFLASVPSTLVFGHGRGKVLLRELARRKLGRELAARPKKGFGVPQARWLRTVLRPRMEAALVRSRRDGSWFKPGAIDALWQAHLHRRADHRRELWTFLFADPFQR